MSDTATFNAKDVAARAKAKAAKIKTAEKFPYEEKIKEREELKATLDGNQEEYNNLTLEINDNLSALGESPLPDEEPVPDMDKLKDRILEVLATFPNGLDGTKLATAVGFIGPVRVTTKHVHALYKTKGQTTLKKKKLADGTVSWGTQLRFFIATKEDAKQIEADKEQEAKEAKARREPTVNA